jgi:acetate kinase
VAILVVNAGSSSLKLRVLDAGDRVVGRRDLPALPDPGALDGLRSFVTELQADGSGLDAVAHRVVHGGSVFTTGVVVTPDVRSRFAELADLAPLHDPQAFAALDAVCEIVPEVPAVACFDTSFHATIPPEAAVYPVPWQWTAEWGIRRFGFHGLSHRYASGRAADLLGRPLADLRIVTAHLGSGCSLAAVAAGRSVDTTMGFTPLDGLMMGTRSGAVDPGALLWVQRHHGLAAEAVEDALDRSSGLLGVSGRSGDIREVLAGEAAGDERCTLAIGIFVHRIRAGIASMAASMGGVDAVVFTGGIGERSAGIRARVVEGLGFLGLAIGDDQGGDEDRAISPVPTRVAVLVVHAREDVVMAAEARRLLDL